MNKFVKPYFWIISMAIFASCSIPKDIPTPRISSQFPDLAPQQVTPNLSAIPWKSFFVDADLQNLIDSTLIKNYDVMIALKNMQKAELIVKQSKLNSVPTVGLGASASITMPSKNSLNGLTLSQYLGAEHLEDYSANIGVSWEADIWGKIHNTNKIAIASYMQSSELKNALKTRLISEVSKGYFNLLTLDAQLDAANRNLKLNESVVLIVKLQFESGEVTELAVQQAQAQCLTSKKLIPQIEQAVLIQESALSFLAGGFPSSIKRAVLLDQVAFPLVVPSEIPIEMVGNRPDVRAKELDLTIANAKVGISRAEMYPALRITATSGLNSIKATNWFNIPSSLFGIAGASVVQPLLERKKLKTRFEIAKIERDNCVIFFRQIVLKAIGEVSDALVKIEKIKSQESIASNRVITLQRASKNAHLLFKSGLANYLEVIITQQNVLSSELELATIKGARLSALVDLYRGLGGGVL